MRQRHVLALTIVHVLHTAATTGGLCAQAALSRVTAGRERPHFSGVYPHLASFNRQNECGTGAVVPFAGKLWWVTYAPHKPNGSDDKLYVMNAARDLFVWRGSVGGTPANRMIHRETKQLLIGPYVIDAKGEIRVIAPATMPGRLTGNARHLEDPERKVYYATMEEGFYEVDLTTLAVKELHPDANKARNKGGTLLPGYHGKGLYSGQGRLIYANNGEKGRSAQRRPDIESGVLAEWDGEGDWRVVRRNQFTEVTGPGGIAGNLDSATDPVWSVGWDHRSLLLMVLDGGRWHRYRLPKASHCYDGAHGWNTEWPRIREIGENDLLMTMHGMFWRFPKSFRPGNTGGLTPRSSYLKVVGDFCRFGDQVVLGCDDAAKAEFLNTRRAKGKLAGPAVSQSNLWFVAPNRLDRLGPTIGRGAVWLDDAVKEGEASDPFCIEGYARRSLHLRHDAAAPVRCRIEIDGKGSGAWRTVATVVVPAEGYAWHGLATKEDGAWARVSLDTTCRASAWFECRGEDRRTASSSSSFDGLAEFTGHTVRGGLVRAGKRATGLQVLATKIGANTSKSAGYYELRPDLSLVEVDDPEKAKWMADHVAIPERVLSIEGDSVLYVDDAGRRFRLPIGNPVYLRQPRLLGQQRAAREVVTERDLFQCAGTFFELPARNAGGFAKIRPVSTHGKLIQDYCSWRGMLVLTGIAPDAKSARIIESKNGTCAVWLGTIDDLWELGKPRGRGGPWRNARAKAGVPSDPYLMAGFDKKRVTLSHDGTSEVSFRLEVDIAGTGTWCAFRTVAVGVGKPTELEFPAGFECYWVRVVAGTDCRATVTFAYE